MFKKFNEHLIENRKEQYYTALMECQKNRNTKDEYIDKWMVFFLNSLKKDLQYLVKNKIINKIGERKSTIYTVS